MLVIQSTHTTQNTEKAALSPSLILLLATGAGLSVASL